MKISVFGSGSWGTAIAMLLFENGHDVTLWSAFEKEAELLDRERENPTLKGVTIPAGIKITADLDAAIEGVEVAVVATPSFAVSETAHKLKGRLSDECLIVCVSKGIEKDTSRLFSDIIIDVLGSDIKFAALSGPTHAEEVSRRIPTACVVASDDREVAERVQSVFMNERFRVYTTDDMIGVELGAALKNVIALSAGICDGMGYGDNTIAMLMTRGLAEMAELCMALGGRKETLAGLAGVGDLIVTCTSRHSRNRRAGVLIGKGVEVHEAMKQVGAVVEGYYAAKAAHDLAAKVGVEMPISEQAYRVLYEGKNASEATVELMSRSKRSEVTDIVSWVK
ncbi:MAG: NAD(P)-dependent glycerol-3-phosphate dehydrogenase [Oscillospiraceae bacterium]|nr:NAD(P)-dependent glycerol-3-phosphate dehydrogenase [Oscillospiraceae bacterium]